MWLHWNGCIHSNAAFIKNCSVAVLFQDISKHLFHLSIIGQAYTEYVTSSKSKVHYKGYGGCVIVVFSCREASLVH